MDFISTKEAAAKWKISRRRVIRLAAEGRIPGVVLFGKSWMIPSGAEKPADGRTKQAKTQGRELPFRFPFYMNAPEDGFDPPLCEEEKALRQAQIDFLACDFERAKTGFENLRKKSDNHCIRIMTLFFLCYLSVNVCGGEDFQSDYHLLNFALSVNDPRQQEMELLRPYLLGCFALFKNAAETFHFDPAYDYAPSAYPLLYFLSFLTKMGTQTAENMDALLEINEIHSKHLEKEGYFYEAQMMHVLLVQAYYYKADKKSAIDHLKKGLDIAREHDFLYPMADIFMYYPDLFAEVLKEYPDEFSGKLSRFGNQIHQSYSAFMSDQKITDLYTDLSKTDYQYVIYAAQGYSNRKIAEIMQVSERTVANHYSEIYDKLHVKGKQELVTKIKEGVSDQSIRSKNAELHMKLNELRKP